jgi:fibronectin-binding autotransporter adhesin
VTIAGGGNVQVSADTTLTLQDTIDGNATVTNDGTITLVQGGDSSLIINGNITLAGSGTVVLSGDGDSIVGTGNGTNTLHNANTIEGSGTIGGDDLVFINQACGIVDADMCGHTLVLDTGYTIRNAGLLEATSGGTLEIDDNVCNTACGVISAAGHDSVVQLNDVTISGGTLETSCGGLIEVLCGVSELDNGSIACGSDVQVDNGATLKLDNDTITGTTFHDACNAVLAVDGGAILTLSGVTVHGGSIDGTDATSGGVVASTIDVTGDSRFCDVSFSHGDLTVEGGVTLALSGDTLRDVTIDGTDATSGGVVASTIDITGDSRFCDVSFCHGDLTVEGGVTLALSGDTLRDVTIDGTDATSGGVVASTIDITGDTTFNDVTLNNGDLTVEACKTLDILTDESGGSSLNGVTVTVDGALNIGDAENHSLVALGDGTTIIGSDTGTLTIAAGSALDVAAGANVTLDGVNVIDNGTIGDTCLNSGATLTLEGGTTITGSHTGGLVVSAGNTLDIEHGGNDGSGGATLDDLNVSDRGALDIGKVGCGATLTLEDGTTVDGTPTGDGDRGTLTIHSGSTLDVEGGEHGGATLQNLSVIDNGALDIGDTGCDAILTLDDGTSISGCGAMTINAGNTLDVDGGITTINLGGTITNNGTLEASNGGELDIAGHVDNSSGMLEATSGGKLDIQSAICGGSATIDHGTLEFGAKSDVDVTFHNSHGYGELILDDAADFSGKIFCFTGTDAGLSNSDEVFLTGVQEGEGGLTANYCGADNITTVIIHEQGGGSITLKFVGDYDAGSFKLQQDANGLEIYDPPAADSKVAPSPPAPPAAGGDHAGTPPDKNGAGTDHGVTSAPGTPPTLATGSAGALDNDSFAFHPTLGNDTAQNTGGHTTELAHGNIQVGGPAVGPIAPEFHQEFTFDAIHQDATNLAAIVDQFHQMASNTTLLH